MISKARERLAERLDGVIASYMQIQGAPPESITITDTAQRLLADAGTRALPLTYRGVHLNVVSHTG